MSHTFSVSEITGSIKQLLEESFEGINVVGEISNFKAHISGHWYFTLKDANAQINCTMWRGINNYVFFTPQDGMKIIVTGRISVYAPRGTYQLDVRSMKPAGEGELQAAFEKLKRDLAGEGLFDEEHKKSIPKYPQKIGIVTAIGGAALRDMLNIAARRFPLVEILIAPVKVQGDGAAAEIAKGIERLNMLNDIDVIIVGRGGGSLEDLWAFNEEIVARSIFASRIPVISGVGHEIDFTIADFVSDLRAPTPSAAMELATPDKDELFAFIDEFSYNSTSEIMENIHRHNRNISQIINSYGFRNPQNIIKSRAQLLDNLTYRIQTSAENKLVFEKNRVGLLSKSIDANNVNKILRKGFTLIKQDDRYIKRAKELNDSLPIRIKFFDNEVDVNKNE